MRRAAADTLGVLVVHRADGPATVPDWQAIAANVRVDHARFELIGSPRTTAGPYDVVVLDATGPEVDVDRAFAPFLGTTGPAMIVLTGEDDVAARVRALDLGADDSLACTCPPDELLARLRSIVRRRSSPLPSLVAGDLELDLLHRRATRAGRALEITDGEFKLLQYFVQHPGVVISRATLRREVWERPDGEGSNYIDVAVRRLRKRVDDGFGPRLIHTLRGSGYTFRPAH